VKFNKCTPAGGWYFKRDPNLTDEDDITDFDNERIADSESDTDTDSNPSEDSAIWDSYHPIRKGRMMGDIPYRRYRDYPNDDEILSLLKAQAKATACMPNLVTMSLVCDLDGPANRNFEIQYKTPGSAIDNSDELDIEGRYSLLCMTGAWRLTMSS
jgi:hypothetical protein